MIIFKKNIYKENGVMGKKRGNIMTTILVFIALLIVFPIIISVRLGEYDLAGVLVILIFISIFLLFILNLFYAVFRKIYKKRYGFRPINNEEWEELQHRNLIHYSNVLTVDEGESEVSIPAHARPKVNHLLPKKYRNQGFVWFHLADDVEPEEPLLKSYLSAHFLEGNPRRQKVVIKCGDFPSHKIYLDVNSGFILVKGDVLVKARVYLNFKWYNEKIYILFLIKTTLKASLTIFHIMYHQLKVEIEDKIHQREAKKQKELNA
ncbi:hypothetical protein C3943_22020 [Lysinibacillus sp. B2A1]|nr:hypothetical protein C3943_22020 [Lysinibacillus sp. B2A1]